MKKHLFHLFFIISSFLCEGQLLPSLGLSSIPHDTTPICKEPYYLGSFYTSGYQQGNNVPDFKLYSLSGDSMQLSQTLAGGKPTLLIAGSLTCPVFRNKVPTINQVVATYSNYINVYVIYTLEAHPTDTSVYFGYVNVTSQNNSQGVLFPQPKTYAQRKAMVDTMSYWVNLKAPVFIDGPCNPWWKNFGPAPNNSYLIGTNGTVLNKHGWFHKSPDHIFCDLDSILGITTGSCNPTPSVPGNFSLTVQNNTVSGMPGQILYDFVDIVNTSTVDVNIKIKKLQVDLPPNWMTAFCADVCYGTSDDSITIQVPANSTMNFSLDFFTDTMPDTGNVRVGFRNIDKPSNSFSMWLSAYTFSPDVSVNELKEKSQVKLFPNPASDKVAILTEEKEFEVKVYTVTGHLKYSGNHPTEINTTDWPPGIYILQMQDKNGSHTGKFIVNR
jgi:hypothetical protein